MWFRDLMVVSYIELYRRASYDEMHPVALCQQIMVGDV